MFIEHPQITPKTIEKRMYQVNIAKTASSQSTLVVLPTGMGKTIVALLIIADILKKKKGKVLFLAPTKPLVEQHAQFVRKFLVDCEPLVFTGETPPKTRGELWKDSNIIISTPQVVVNDLISARTSLDDFGLIIFDEAHRATGDYAYVFIAEKYHFVNGLALGMTASPGSEANRILEVCNNLGIERVEIRSEFDPDVMPYVHDIKVRWKRVSVPPKFQEIIGLLKHVYQIYIKELKKFGFLRGNKPVSMKDLLKVQREIRARIADGGGRQSSYYSAASAQAAAVKVNHALELVETQGIGAMKNYLDRMGKEAYSRGASKAAKSVMNQSNVKRVLVLADKIQVEHPKLEYVVSEVQKQLKAKRNSKIIVFTHYRDTSLLVCDELGEHKGIKPVRFVGQASRGEDKGLSQKKQVELIQNFKDGKYNVLVATSVAEEGLDIPSTDLVVFYEPVPSEIRTIQRRGRTGRKRAGKVVVLMAKHTRDEAYYWSSISKEKRMKRELHVLRTQLSSELKVGEPKLPSKDEVDFIKNMPDQEIEIEHEMEIKEESPEPVLESNEKPEIDERKKEEKPPKTKKQKKAPKPQEPQTTKKGQARLFEFQGKERKTKIIADTREFNSDVVRELSRKGIIVDSQQLDVGDYILSDRLAVERKESNDFLKSLMDGRLFSQLKLLKSAYINPILVLEGQDIMGRGISDAAIYGALASIISDFKIPIIQTSNMKETANLLAVMAKREISEKRQIGIRGDKVSMSLQERQQFIIEGLPGVSATLAQRLLDHFGSVEAVISASEKELCEVKGIGNTIAQSIVEVIKSGYLKK